MKRLYSVARRSRNPRKELKNEGIFVATLRPRRRSARDFIGNLLTLAVLREAHCHSNDPIFNAS
jgi:hypothetical protein